MTTPITLEVDVDNLARQLTYMTYDDLIDFVMTVDACISDTVFTHALIRELTDSLGEALDGGSS